MFTFQLFLICWWGLNNIDLESSNINWWIKFVILDYNFLQLFWFYWNNVQLTVCFNNSGNYLTKSNIQVAFLVFNATKKRDYAKIVINLLVIILESHFIKKLAHMQLSGKKKCYTWYLVIFYLIKIRCIYIHFIICTCALNKGNGRLYFLPCESVFNVHIHNRWSQ